MKIKRVAVAAVTLFVNAALASSAESELVWQTRVKLSVVQWFPIEGEFRQLEALGGEFEVSSQGSVLLPVLGSVNIGDSDANALAGDIAIQLQERMGLLQAPEVRLEIIGQRPIYVVGMVEAPGETVFRPGMTVLQALALGGGPLRPEEQAQEARIGLLSRLTMLDDDIDLALARIARFEAEASGADAIVFPPELDTEKAGGLVSQERRIFELRVEGLKRQQIALGELKKLYEAEVDVLRSRIINLDDRVAAAEGNMERINTLLGRGLATVSQRTDVEILLGDLRSDRLDHLTGQMRAQQLISQADRDLTSLADTRQSEVAETLLSSRADLARLRIERQSVVRLLEEHDRKLMASGTEAGSLSQIRYTIVRLGEELAATEAALLEPGDVVRVSLSAPSMALPSIPDDAVVGSLGR